MYWNIISMLETNWICHNSALPSAHWKARFWIQSTKTGTRSASERDEVALIFVQHFPGADLMQIHVRRDTEKQNISETSWRFISP